MERVNKILLTGSPFTWNYGSMALVVSAVDSIHGMYPNTRFYKTSIDKIHDVKNYRRYFGNGLLKIIGVDGGNKHGALMTLLLLLKSIKFMRKCDLVLEVSGEIPEDYSVYSLFLRVLLAKIVGKPFVVYAMGFGPYKYRFTGRILKICFRLCDKVMIRENISKRYLENMGIMRLQLTADQAFLFRTADEPQKLLVKLIGKELKGFVVICPKEGYRKYADYIQGLRQSIRVISEQKPVIVLAHGKQDLKMARNVYDPQNKNVYLIGKAIFPDEAKAIISLADLVISSRVHGGIAALSSGVPAIFLIPKKDHRGSGMLGEMYGFPEYVISPTESVRCGELFIGMDYRRIKKCVEEQNEQVFEKVRMNAEMIGGFLK